MIRTAVCDDQEMFAKRVKTMVDGYFGEQGIMEETSCYTDGKMLLYDVEEGRNFDLFFLDIEMPEMTGMDLAARIRTQLPEAFICFITSHTKYAVKAYELSVFRYIPKPELETCLPLALSDVHGALKRKSQDVYVVESARKLQKIPVDDILYICKEQKNSIFVLRDQSRAAVRKPLNQVLKELERTEFLMVERGYVVNLYHVMKLEGSLIYMRGGDTLPVGGSRQKDVWEAVSSFWRDRL